MDSNRNSLMEALLRPAKVRYYVLGALIVFVLGFFGGGLAGGMNYESANATITSIHDNIDPSWEQDTLAEALGIFENNLGVSVAVFLGCVLIIPGMMILGFNGGVIGMLFAWGVHKVGLLAVPVLFIGILPHGIIEIPAILLAAAMGFRFLHTAIIVLAGRMNPVDGLKIIAKSLGVLCLVVPAMLFVAAFIESYFTAWLLGLVS